MMLAMLSMAVGTGNIWRFPRIAATNGGGEFLVAWVICLFTWSIPLILVEFGMGRMTRLGPIGAFVRTQGKKSAWMGAFIAFVAVAIMAYYSVVTGWTLRYAIAAGFGEVTGDNSVSFWRTFSTTTAPVLPHVISMLAAKLASEIPEVPADMIPLLDAKAMQAELEAWGEERDNSPIRWAPNISAYTR